MVSRLPLLLLAAVCGAPLVGTTLVLAQTDGPPSAATSPAAPEPAAAPLPPPPPPPSAPVVPTADLPAPERPTAPAPAMTERTAPLRPTTAELQPERPRRFDASLDALVRDGIVSPRERIRVRGTLVLDPPAGLRNQACSSGALSAEECRTGVVFRGRGRLEGEGALRAGEPASGLGGGGWSGGGFGGGGVREGIAASPLPPISVPVNALLAGINGRLRLTDVFRLTPRPAPIGGNGNLGLIFPLIGSAVPTSPFGWRMHPILGTWIMHSGRDFAAPEGTPVVAALSGRVVSSGEAGGYGLAVELEHGKPLRRTLYGHLSEIYVREGDSVRQGEVIGRVGSTGLSTGPHLHFELRLPRDGGWVATDPGDLQPGRPSGPFPNLSLPGLPGLSPRPATPPDAVAVLFGQLLQTLERPAPAVGRKPNAPLAPPAPGSAPEAPAAPRQAG